MFGVQFSVVAPHAAPADLESQVPRRRVRIVAGAAPKVLAADLGAATERKLFDVAHNLEPALPLCVIGTAHEYRPEFFHRTARLEGTECLTGVLDPGKA